MNRNPFWFCPIILPFFLREPCLGVWGDHEARDGWGVITSAPFLMQISEELVHLGGEKNLKNKGYSCCPVSFLVKGQKLAIVILASPTRVPHRVPACCGTWLGDTWHHLWKEDHMAELFLC